jgi:hypothetical protein
MSKQKFVGDIVADPVIQSDPDAQSVFGSGTEAKILT